MKQYDAPILKRSVNVAGHRTSITLEQPFWEALKLICAEKNVSLSTLIAEIDAQNPRNLSSALRVFILARYRDQEPVKD